jgi:hypothetical protein
MATACANTGDMERAHAHLVDAVPRFRSCNDVVGQATSLRNLAQVRAHKGDFVAAIDAVLEALPLILRRTLTELDHDQYQDSTVRGFFRVRLRDEVKLNHREQFRARAWEEMVKSGRVKGSSTEHVPMPMDIIVIIKNGCVAATSEAGIELQAWERALNCFETTLNAQGKQYRYDVEFVRSLIDLLNNRDVNLPNEHIYRGYIEQIRQKLTQVREGRAVLPKPQVIAICENTIAAAVNGGEEAKKWSNELKQFCAGADEWGDESERTFARAMLNVVHGRLASLCNGHSYAPYLQQVLDEVSKYQILSAASLVDNTVACKKINKARAPEWERIVIGYRDSLELPTEQLECDFLEAILSILRDKPAYLPEGSPYVADLRELQAAVTAGAMIRRRIPEAKVQGLVSAVRTAKEKGPDAVIDMRRHLNDAIIRTAEGAGDSSEKELFLALLGLLDGKHVGLAKDNSYSEFLQVKITGQG